ncbi:uncharacterized protein LOC143282735 [Babylonia areolata]|uniref:uncharacterized protein LOC143282735 n=1 Tax=Babylonia areolata TaxID=304850 RepID=UPI003FD51A3B
MEDDRDGAQQQQQYSHSVQPDLHVSNTDAEQQQQQQQQQQYSDSVQPELHFSNADAEQQQQQQQQYLDSVQPEAHVSETDAERILDGEPSYSPFAFDDYYNYRASGMDYDQYYRNPDYGQNCSDSNSDDEGLPQQSTGDSYTYSMDGAQLSQRSFRENFDAEGAYSRFGQNSDEEDGKVAETPEIVLVDPGPFQYNKRVFITALPCLLLTLIMTGEMLLLMVTIGGLLIALMAQIGGDVSKRCVVVFALLFIPCHILVIGTVIPLLWLSVWNLLLVAIVNLFCILTGGWVIIQFQAFRKEEPVMCAVIERALFSAYPCVCSALVTWVLATVVSPPLTPFLFVCIWFVCLQLYLMPAASSFKLGDKVKDGGSKEEEDLGILRQPTIMALILAFVVSGPALHAVLTVAGYSLLKFASLSSLAMLAMLACLGLFLSTLLNLRQLCDHFGWRHVVVVQGRWVSGAGVVVLSYPVLQQQGVVSHFLLSLPVAVASFAALALALSLRKGKVLPLVLMAVLMALLCLWLNHLPWSLTYYFLGTVPLKTFFGMVAANFVLCVVAIYASWHGSKEIFGCLLLLQSIGLTVCEVGLQGAGLYSLPAFQLTGALAAYALHRLHLAARVTRCTAALSSAVHLTKTALGALSYLGREGERAGAGVGAGARGEGVVAAVVEISTADYLTLLLLVGVVVWLFVYETKEEITVLQAGKHVLALMVSLGVSGQSFLLPLGDFLLQDDLSLADLVGLWYGLGGVLMLLYALQYRLSEGLTEGLVKVAVVMAGVGALVTTMQPQFLPTLQAAWQWGEVLSVLLVAALLATGVEMSLAKVLLTSLLLGVAPGVHATLMMYEDIPTVMHFVLVSVLSCLLLALLLIVAKVEEMTEAVEKVIRVGAVTVLAVLLAVVVVDVINFEYLETVWDYPAWTLLLGASAIVSISLKALALKLGPNHLPLVKREDRGLPLVPLIGNVFTLSAFLLAGTQGPYDPLLHDLWFCAASLFLVCLQRDPVLLPGLSPANRAAPTALAAVGTLATSTLLQSHLWGGWWSEDVGVGAMLLGLVEVAVVLASLPVYVVMGGILWEGRIWSEKAVVFSMPLNALLLVAGSSYTAWVLCAAGFVCGLGMMVFRLPLLPNNFEPLQR